MSNYYNWERTLAYDADVTMVVGSRGLGKTFGLRRQCINDYINHKWRFVEVTRFKKEISGVVDGYFEKLSKLKEFDKFVFKAEGRGAFIASKPEGKEKPKWLQIGYFCALSEYQELKKHTFVDVRRIIMDEAIIERSDKYHRYLPNEYAVLASIVDTTSRERSDTKGVKPRVYLLANACDLANPYFIANKVGTDLEYGYRWFSNKTFLLHYVEPGEYEKHKRSDTVAGRMLQNTESGKIAIENKFVHSNLEFVKKKSKNAKFSFGIVCNGDVFGIWLDQNQGLYYVSNKVVKGIGKPIYSLTRDDASVNYIAVLKVSKNMQYIQQIYQLGMFRYESEAILNKFGNVLKLFGVR